MATNNREQKIVGCAKGKSWNLSPSPCRPLPLPLNLFRRTTRLIFHDYDSGVSPVSFVMTLLFLLRIVKLSQGRCCLILGSHTHRATAHSICHHGSRVCSWSFLRTQTHQFRTQLLFVDLGLLLFLWWGGRGWKTTLLGSYLWWPGIVVIVARICIFNFLL